MYNYLNQKKKQRKKKKKIIKMICIALLALKETFKHRRFAMATNSSDPSIIYTFIEKDGDLFSAPKTHALAHCVGSDFAMAGGIAVKFKQIFGQVDELLSQGAQTGELAILRDEQRYIYYLVTKPCSWDRPTYGSLRSSLEAMREHMLTNNVDKLAIPRIGCGIDGLEWSQVSQVLKEVFGKDRLEIIVYNFVPK